LGGTAGFKSTAIGVSALCSLGAISSDNTAVGYLAGEFTTANNNTFVGSCAGRCVTTGAQNIVIGKALSGTVSPVTSSGNIAIGNSVLGGGGGGSNIAISGGPALSNLTTGVGNIAIGCGGTGTGITSGNYNIVLGGNNAIGLTTGCANIVIGGQNTGGGGLPVFSFPLGSENSRVLMGASNTTNAYIQVAWTVVSDARDKIVEGPVPYGLSFVEKLEPKTFYFREERDSNEPYGPKRYGFLAQEILALEGDDPVIIDTEDPEKLKYKGEALVPVLVNAIKELAAKVEALEAKLND
jgi:hypothetical protein